MSRSAITVLLAVHVGACAGADPAGGTIWPDLGLAMGSDTGSTPGPDATSGGQPDASAGPLDATTGPRDAGSNPPPDSGLMGGNPGTLDTNGDGVVRVMFFGHSLMGWAVPLQLSTFIRERHPDLTVIANRQIGAGTAVGSHVLNEQRASSFYGPNMYNPGCSSSNLPTHCDQGIREQALIEGAQGSGSPPFDPLWAGPGVIALETGLDYTGRNPSAGRSIPFDIVVVTDVHEREIRDGSGRWLDRCSDNTEIDPEPSNAYYPGLEDGELGWLCAKKHLATITNSVRSLNPAARVIFYAAWSYANEATDDAERVWRHGSSDLSNWVDYNKNNIGWWEHVAAAASGRDGDRSYPYRYTGSDTLPIEVFPATWLLADVVERVQSGDVPGLRAAQLFDDGVHTNQLGFYPVSLALYAMLSGEQIGGLPTVLDTKPNVFSVERRGFRIDAERARSLQAASGASWQAFQSR